MADFYANRLRALIENPSSFTQTPGYQARMDAITQAAARGASGQIGSANYGYALQDAASKGVSSEYDREIARAESLANDERTAGLAEGQLGLQGELGRGNLGLGYYRAGNEFDLGQGALDNTAHGQWYDYSLGRERNSIASADSQNRYNVDSYNAETSRGAARSNAFNQGQATAQGWYKTRPQRGMNPVTGGAWYTTPRG